MQGDVPNPRLPSRCGSVARRATACRAAQNCSESDTAACSGVRGVASPRARSGRSDLQNRYPGWKRGLLLQKCPPASREDAVIGNIRPRVVIGDGAVIGRDVHMEPHAGAPAD